MSTALRGHESTPVLSLRAGLSPRKGCDVVESRRSTSSVRSARSRTLTPSSRGSRSVSERRVSSSDGSRSSAGRSTPLHHKAIPGYAGYIPGSGLHGRNSSPAPQSGAAFSPQSGQAFSGGGFGLHQGIPNVIGKGFTNTCRSLPRPGSVPPTLEKARTAPETTKTTGFLEPATKTPRHSHKTRSRSTPKIPYGPGARIPGYSGFVPGIHAGNLISSCTPRAAKYAWNPYKDGPHLRPEKV